MRMYVGSDQTRVDQTKATNVLKGLNEKGPILCTDIEQAIPYSKGKLIVVDLPETILDNATRIKQDVYMLNDEFNRPLLSINVQKIDVLTVN